ncbi:MarR family winged helix-turn-helix transcriptional regulator [Anoxynatronum sibiricum]|uniref:MarR family transcriptional regulator n=1 Tax=Anoxynatronum sibiricum TaxID=210623 RepID=A0ABU9VSZ8_9CLOT
MNPSDEFLQFVTDNLKKIFFPEEWLELDMKVSKTELFALLYLSRKENTTMTELAATMGLPMSTATGLMDRLVRQQYVRRGRSEEDRRIVVLVLTEAGQELVDNFKKVMSEYFAMIMDDLTVEEHQLLMRIALKVFRKLKQRKESEEEQVVQETGIKRIEIE